MTKRLVVGGFALAILAGIGALALRPEPSVSRSPAPRVGANPEAAAPALDVPSPPAPARIDLGTATAGPENPEPGEVRVGGTVSLFASWIEVAEARVRLVVPETGEELAASTSDSEGRYEVRAELSRSRLPLRVRLVAEKEGSISWAWSEAFLTVARLPWREGQSLSLYAPLELSGRVTDASGLVPIAGARVWEKGDRRESRFERAVTDASGFFRARVADVPKGTLFVEADGYLPASVEWLRDESDRPLEVALARDEEIPRAEGRVLDEEGAPSAGARVNAFLLGDWSEGPGGDDRAARSHLAFLRKRVQWPGAETDSEGRFSIPLPAFATWRVTARSGSRFAMAKVEVERASVFPVELRFRAPSLVVSGSVKAMAGGLPLAGATVLVNGAFSGQRARVTTDARGEFRTPPLRDEECIVLVVGAPPPLPLLPYRSWVSRPETGDEVRVEVFLYAPCHLRGRVVDEEDAPVAGALVRAEAASSTFSARTDEQGRFEFHELPAGVELRVQAKWVERLGDRESEEVRLVVPHEGETPDLGDLIVRSR